jgi:hypothetical protein
MISVGVGAVDLSVSVISMRVQDLACLISLPRDGRENAGPE